MPTTTRSGRQQPIPDTQPTKATKNEKTRKKAVEHPMESDGDGMELPERPNVSSRGRVGPKSVVSTYNQEESSVCRPRPKPRPLPRSSKRSAPLTSSAEEDIFVSNFSRRSSIISKESDHTGREAEEQSSATPHVEPADGSPLSSATLYRVGDEVTADGDEVTADGDEVTADGDEELAPAPISEGRHQSSNSTGVVTGDKDSSAQHQSNNSVNITTCDQDTSVSTVRSQLNDPSICKGTSVFAAQGESNHPVATRPRRSDTVKSYEPDHSDGAESSPSDSDWAASEEKRKKVARLSTHNNNDNSDHGPPLASPPRLSAKEKGKGTAKAVDEGRDDEGSDEDEDDGEDDDEDEDEDRSTKHDKGSAKKGRLPQEAVSKAQELGRKTAAAAAAIGKEYGKSARTILIEAGLAKKATRKESPWNQHQAWYGTTFPASEEPDFKTWQAKQYAHYKAHLPKDPKHAALWQEIQEYYTHSNAGTTEHLSSRSASSMMYRVRDDFASSACYWFRTHGVHIAGVVIFPGDEESGRQASGFFSGSDIMKDIINSRQINIQRYLDELTTILKYKDLEAAQAEGKTLGLLPASTSVPNGTLLCNSKSSRDRNRKVAPMIISEKFAEAGHPLKTSNSRWLTMLDTLYAEKLCIHDWPAGVPPPGSDFDLKALSASQLRALVAPYLRSHLGAMYEADLGQEDEDDDTEAAAAKMKKRKSKSKKSSDNRRTKGVMVKEPDVVLSIHDWSESDAESFESQSPSMYLIPLVIDTDGLVLRILQDSNKFFKDFPPNNTSQRPIKKKVIEEPLSSDQGASRSTTGAAHSTTGAARSTNEASRLTNRASRSTTGAVRLTSMTNGASRLTNGASRSTNGALRSTNGASRSTNGVLRSTNGALRSTNGASGINYRAPSSLREASRLRRPTNWHIYQDLPPSSPPTPSSILSPPVSCPSSPIQDSCNSDSACLPNPQYKHAHREGQRQHGHDAGHPLPYDSGTRKRTRAEYETTREADDMESKIVKGRYKSRLHDNGRRLHSGRPQTHASTSRSQLPTYSSVAPVSRRSGTSQHHHYSRMQSSRFRPKSPDCRAIIEVNEESEDEEYEDEEYEDEYH